MLRLKSSGVELQKWELQKGISNSQRQSVSQLVSPHQQQQQQRINDMLINILKPLLCISGEYKIIIMKKISRMEYQPSSSASWWATNKRKNIYIQKPSSLEFIMGFILWVALYSNSDYKVQPKEFPITRPNPYLMLSQSVSCDCNHHILYSH